MEPEDMALNFHEMPMDLFLSQTMQITSLHIIREVVALRVTKENTRRRRIAPLILNLGTCGGMWSAWRPGRFVPEERAPSTHWVGGWLGLTVGLDVWEKR